MASSYFFILKFVHILWRWIFEMIWYRLLLLLYLLGVMLLLFLMYLNNMLDNIKCNYFFLMSDLIVGSKNIYCFTQLLLLLPDEIKFLIVVLFFFCFWCFKNYNVNVSLWSSWNSKSPLAVLILCTTSFSICLAKVRECRE